MAASWLTTTQANKHANIRHTRELAHERDIERRKLLHSRAYELFDQASIAAMNFILFTAEAAATSRSLASFSELIPKIHKETDAIIDLIPRIRLLGSPQVVSAYISFQRCALEVSGHMLRQLPSPQDTSPQEVIKIEIPQTVRDLLMEANDAALEVMRAELGVLEPLSPTTSDEIRRQVDTPGRGSPVRTIWRRREADSSRPAGNEAALPKHARHSGTNPVRTTSADDDE